MKKIIIFEEEEFKEKFFKFCNNFFEQQKQGYGVKLISNETSNILDTKESIYGIFYIIWGNTFNK